jgi:hypothetical protein
MPLGVMKAALGLWASAALAAWKIEPKPPSLIGM